MNRSAVNRLYRNTTFRTALAVALFSAGTILPFFLIPFESYRFRDEPYQAFCALQYDRAWAAILTFYTGNVWMTIFGRTFVALRLLMTLCYVASIAIGCLYIRKNGVSSLKASAVYLIGTLGAVMTFLPVYNWDCGAYPATALGMACALSYIDNPTDGKLVAMGCVAGLMGLLRVPLVAVLVLMIAIVILTCKRDEASLINCIRKISLLILCALCAFFGVVSVLKGSPTAYFKVITEGNTVAGHSITDIGGMADFQVWLLKKQYMLMLPGCAAIGLAYLHARAKCWRAWITAASILIIAYLLRSAINNQSWWTLFWTHNGIMTPAAFIAILYPWLQSNVIGIETSGKTRLSVIILVCFAALQGFGSDAPVERFGWMLPMVFSFGVTSRASVSGQRFIRYFIGFTTVTIIGYFLCVYQRLDTGWNEARTYHYATAFNGTRQYKPFSEAEAIDSLKFITDNARRIGIPSTLIGSECAKFEFIMGSDGLNSAIRFALTDDEVREDYLRNAGNKESQLILWFDSEKDSQLRTMLTDDRYDIYFKAFGGRYLILARDSAMRMLPETPFETWDYRCPSE